MDDTLRSAALAAAEAQRHEIQQATLQWNVGLLEAAFLAGVEWYREQVRITEEENIDGPNP